jgi:uncharacterized protein YceK
MTGAWRATALLIMAGFLSGCGTAANISVGAREGWQYAPVYGGVRRDVQSAENWVEHTWTWGENLDLQRDLGTVVGVALVGIDVPLSALGDTLTLPITIPAYYLSKSRSGTNGRGNPPPNPPPVAAPPQ